jgi:hypothetical protein
MIRCAHHGKLKYLQAKNASIYEVLKPNQAEWDTGFPFRPET